MLLFLLYYHQIYAALVYSSVQSFNLIAVLDKQLTY